MALAQLTHRESPRNIEVCLPHCLNTFQALRSRGIPEDRGVCAGTVRCRFPQTTDYDAMNAPDNPLTKEQIAQFAQRIGARKSLLLSEIRQVLARSRTEHIVDLIGGSGDSGDVAAASLIRDVTEAEIIRDIGEVRDIAAAEDRIAAGTYGLCTDCGQAIRYKRLDAYPTAKRCFACQVRREKLQAPSPYTGR